MFLKWLRAVPAQRLRLHPVRSLVCAENGGCKSFCIKKFVTIGAVVVGEINKNEDATEVQDSLRTPPRMCKSGW